MTLLLLDKGLIGPCQNPLKTARNNLNQTKPIYKYRHSNPVPYTVNTLRAMVEF